MLAHGWATPYANPAILRHCSGPVAAGIGSQDFSQFLRTTTPRSGRSDVVFPVKVVCRTRGSSRAGTTPTPGSSKGRTNGPRKVPRLIDQDPRMIGTRR